MSSGLAVKFVTWVTLTTLIDDCHVCILLTSWLLFLFCICMYVCYHYVV